MDVIILYRATQTNGKSIALPAAILIHSILGCNWSNYSLDSNCMLRLLNSYSFPKNIPEIPVAFYDPGTADNIDFARIFQIHAQATWL